MIWEDECYLLSKRKFRENANIINIFSKKKGKLDGIVYGGTSRKVKNYLQISNKLFVSHTSKSENKIGYFKTELIKPISPIFFDDKERTSALISICSLLNILLPVSQPNKKIYNSFEKLINSINLENWIFAYIFFEINLIKDLGYDTNLTEYSNDINVNKDFLKIKIDEYIYEIPNYLIQKKIPESFTNLLIRKSLYFTRQVMLNKFFIPSNLVFPKFRVILENYFN
jgi:DNA repair protein RecO (recombination protein O)|tara:strand:+ start:1271 stop:1951 length:681 start_codon:yes stop_codon:yes gene_type:complete